MSNNPIDPATVNGTVTSNVRYLPATRTDRTDTARGESTAIERVDRTEIEPAGEILEGEIVSAREYNTRQKAAAFARWKGYQRDAVTVYQGAKTVVTHQRTKSVARHVLAYPVAGVGVVWRRWRDAHGVGRYERQMRAAEVIGDQEAVRYWQEADVAEKQRRHDRVMDWVSYLNPWLWIKYGTLAVAGLALFLLFIGVITAVNTGEFSDVVAPISGVLAAVAFAVWFLTVYGVFLLLGGSAATLFYLYSQGRRHGDVPDWLQATTANASGVDSAVDESVVMNALRNLGHPALNKKFKEGWGSTVAPTWVQPPLPVGHGWEFALRLPGGVPATSINARKSVLAHNLGRRPEEVWVEVEDTDPMAMKALVLDPGSLREPVPDYPLLADLDNARTDFWTGFPVGIDARWNEVVTSVFERNFVKAGIMGSGKSTLIQDELAGAVLDPVVDIDVFCFAENNDFEWLRPVASTISMGDTAENVDACMTHIQALKDSLAERGQLLREYGIDSVTREAAEKDDRLRPRFVVIDECQSFFRQDKPEDRRELVNLMVRFYSAARKYGIVLCFATPTPSDQSLPRDLVAVTTNKACFAIGDKTRNNVVLGEKAYENGLSALELKPAVKKAGKIVALNDVGTCVAVGFTDQPGLLRSYNLTHQQKAAIVARGVELRGGRTRTAVTEQQPRDLLTDVAAVLAPGEDKVKATDVCARLREHAPQHRPYTAMTADALRDQLGVHGCKVTKVGVLMVFTERVHEALADREGGNV